MKCTVWTPVAVRTCREEGGGGGGVEPRGFALREDVSKDDQGAVGDTKGRKSKEKEQEMKIKTSRVNQSFLLVRII